MKEGLLVKLHFTFTLPPQTEVWGRVDWTHPYEGGQARGGRLPLIISGSLITFYGTSHHLRQPPIIYGSLLSFAAASYHWRQKNEHYFFRTSKGKCSYRRFLKKIKKIITTVCLLCLILCKSVLPTFFLKFWVSSDYCRPFKFAQSLDQIFFSKNLCHKLEDIHRKILSLAPRKSVMFRAQHFCFRRYFHDILLVQKKINFAIAADF